MIQIADNMFTANEIAMIEKSVRDLPYNINTTDDGNFSSGAASPMPIDTIMYEVLKMKIYKAYQSYNNKNYMIVIQIVFSGEFTQFHTDNECEGSVTVLYYCNENEWKDGGTEVLFEDELRVESILPISGRLMRMLGNQLHRATSFRDKKRLNVAYKFRPYD